MLQPMVRKVAELDDKIFEQMAARIALWDIDACTRGLVLLASLLPESDGCISSILVVTVEFPSRR